MQGAKTAKFKLPCGRRAHLHKSISFKIFFEQIPQNHENYPKTDPKMIKQSIKQT